MLQSIVLAAALAAAVAPGQSTSPLSFDVASVKSAAPCCAPGQWRESRTGDDRIDFRYVTLRYCVAFAWSVKEYQISGPSWITEVRYDLVAKGPEGTRRDQLPEMMRKLLAERFQLAVHREKKEFNVFALVVRKNGPKLEESKAESGGAEGASFGISMSGTGVGRMEVRHADMKALANTLPRFVGRPVVDQTGLAARYDFDLEFSREDVNAMGIAPPGPALQPAAEFGVSIFTSIQRIGLRLDAVRMALDTIVVDRAQKTPAEN